MKLKVTPEIQDQVRVRAKKKYDLQAIMRTSKKLISASISNFQMIDKDTGDR